MSLTPMIDRYDEIVRSIGDNIWGIEMFDLVRDRGVVFESVPWGTWRGTGYRRGPERNCFGNCSLMCATFPELTYVEGWAATEIGFAVHHAWCVTEDGRVVDPTWRDRGRNPLSWEYRGVPFTTEAVALILERQDVFGLMQTRWVFEQFDPLWVPERWRAEA